jgi:predicted kinase
MKSTKTLIILRGIPGSGKSTLAQTLTKAVCTADDWFMRNGEYNWDYRNIGDAHAWCQRKCSRFMQVGVDKIVVANTNITEKSMQPYVDMAEKFGYKIFYLIVENRHGNQSVHNVPDATLENMRKNFSIKL